MTKEQIYNLLKDIELKNNTINHILEELAKDIELEKLSSNDAKNHLKKCWKIIDGFGKDSDTFYYKDSNIPNYETKQIIHSGYIAVSLVKEDMIPNVPDRFIGSYYQMEVVEKVEASIFATDIYLLLTKDIKEDERDLTLVIDHKEIILDSKLLVKLLWLLGMQNADGVVLHYNPNNLYAPLYIEKTNGSIGMIAAKTIMG